MAVSLAVFLSAPAWAQEAGSSSGLPLPRFVSAKADQVNMRVGPSRDHPVKWTYVRRGLPLEVIAEYDNWRQVRDSTGDEGWVYHALLDGRRSVILSPPQEQEYGVLRSAPESEARAVARAERGVIARLLTCRSGWCRVEANGIRGWVTQTEIWGVHSGETVK